MVYETLPYCAFHTSASRPCSIATTHLELIITKQLHFFELVDPLSDSRFKKVCSDINVHVKKLFANHELRLASTPSSRLHFTM